MPDKTDNPWTIRAAAILLALTVAGAMQTGCEKEWKEKNQDPPNVKSAPEKTNDTPTGDSRKFQPPRTVAPEDVEAFQNAVDQISRLEYGPAETEIRVLLVRFESVDDPKYVSEALFWLGYCCEKQGVTDQARDYYQRLIEHYAKTRPGIQAKQRLKLLPKE